MGYTVSTASGWPTSGRTYMSLHSFGNECNVNLRVVFLLLDRCWAHATAFLFYEGVTACIENDLIFPQRDCTGEHLIYQPECEILTRVALCEHKYSRIIFHLMNFIRQLGDCMCPSHNLYKICISRASCLFKITDSTISKRVVQLVCIEYEQELRVSPSWCWLIVSAKLPEVICQLIFHQAAKKS